MLPRTLGGLLGFALTATLTVMVGTFLYNRFVAPAIGALKKAA